jgi:hypothetical protein
MPAGLQSRQGFLIVAYQGDTVVPLKNNDAAPVFNWTDANSDCYKKITDIDSYIENSSLCPTSAWSRKLLCKTVDSLAIVLQGSTWMVLNTTQAETNTYARAEILEVLDSGKRRTAKFHHVQHADAAMSVYISHAQFGLQHLGTTPCICKINRHMPPICSSHY